MLKRLIYGGIFAFVCLGLAGIFLFKKLNKESPAEFLQAIPGDAILFIENLDYSHFSQEFLPESRIWSDYIQIAGRNSLDSLVHSTMNRIAGSEGLLKILEAEGLNLSLHLVGKTQIQALIYLHYEGVFNDHEFENFMSTLFEEKAMINQRKYEAISLFDVSGEPGLIPGTFSFACLNGWCLLSASSMLVEEAIRNMHSDADLRADSGLQKVRSTAGTFVDANIYINYPYIPRLFYPYLMEDQWKGLDKLSRLTSWAELDLDLKKDALIMNGMSYVGPGEALLLGLFSGQDPVRMQLHEVIPSGVNTFFHMGISDPEIFRQSFMDYLQAQGRAEAVGEEAARLSGTYGIDPLEDLLRIMDDEMAWFTMAGKQEGSEASFLILETRSRSEAVDVVMSWVRTYLQLHAYDMDAFRSVYQLDDQTRFNIYKLPDPYFKDLLPAELFKAYFTLYDKYLIFGPSPDQLSRVIYQNVLQKTFVNEALYEDISGSFANRSSIRVFVRPYAFLESRMPKLRPSLREDIQTAELFLRRLPALVVQFSREGDMFYHSMSCSYTTQLEEEAMTVWESLMDTVARIKPALVQNHNTGAKEILVQDAAHKIYLINSAGRILWKQALEGPVLGEIHQVDFYKNGKLQYLFNTRQKIHLIDRNGNYVERYPVILRSQATAPLALFDYDRSRDYRIFIPTEDRSIYLYDLEGKVVSGWRFGKTESRVERELQHFRLGDRDYILACDQNRSYILDRRGRERIRIRDRVVFSPNNPLNLDMNIREDRPRWVSTDTAGNVMAVYLDGSVKKLMEKSLSQRHFFRMLDLDKDGNPEYLFADGNELEAVHTDGRKLFSFKVRGRITFPPDIYSFSASDIKIGLTDVSRGRIYLLNADGSLYQGFPLEGSTRFSIGYFADSNSRFNLIVGSDHHFLYNYSIQ